MNPLIIISRIIPSKPELLTGEFLDRLHLILSGTEIYHSRDRDDVYLIVKEALTDCGIVKFFQKDGEPYIVQGKNAVAIINKYGVE